MGWCGVTFAGICKELLLQAPGGFGASLKRLFTVVGSLRLTSHDLLEVLQLRRLGEPILWRLQVEKCVDFHRSTAGISQSNES